jgi:hypothetical protein
MDVILRSQKAVGLHVKVNHRGSTKHGVIDRVLPNDIIVVRFDAGEVGEWDDDFDYFHPRDIKPDYDPESMKALMKKWRESTGTSAGPEGPMKHVKSFLTGRSRKLRNTKKARKTRKSKKRI